MIFKKSAKAYLVLLGILSFFNQSNALELCSNQRCNNIEPSNFPEIAEKLNRILTFLETGDYIQLCKSNPEMTECVTSDIGYLILGGFLLPMRGRITGYNIERVEDSVNMIADAGMATCRNSDLIFSNESDSIILKNSSSYFCNWLGVGNVMSYTELTIKKIDLDKLHFYGNYKVTAVGTAIGSGEGVGSFQVKKGEAVLAIAKEKYDDLVFFNIEKNTISNTISVNESAENDKAYEESSQGSNHQFDGLQSSQLGIKSTSQDAENPAATSEQEVKNSLNSNLNDEVSQEKLIDEEGVRAQSLTTEKTNAERENAQREARERAEAQRIAAEREKAEQEARERAEAQRIAAERENAQRQARERAEGQRLAAEREKAEQESRALAEVQRLVSEKEAIRLRIQSLGNMEDKNERQDTSNNNKSVDFGDWLKERIGN